MKNIIANHLHVNNCQPGGGYVNNLLLINDIIKAGDVQEIVRNY